MSTIALADWEQSSPEIVIGENERRRVTVAALTDVVHGSDHMDFLLYELDRAKVVPDTLVPADVVRLGSMVRYWSAPGEERTIKLVMPSEIELPGNYRLAVTSAHGAALLGLKAGAVMTWMDPDGTTHRIEVLQVANT
jgi:regulator of nucleoside diphosphate kinase